MRYNFPANSSVEETIKINELLSANESYYTLGALFQYLPHDIEYRERRGYLSVSTMGIEYTALDPVPEVKVCMTFPFGNMANKNPFEAFIDALEWFEKHKEDIKINE